MSLLSAIGKLIGGQDTFLTSNHWYLLENLKVTIGDISREELLKMTEGKIHQRLGYPPECKFVEEFLNKLEISSEVKEVCLKVVRVPDGDWYWMWCGEDTNPVAKSQGLQFCTPEVVLKLFLEFEKVMRETNKEATLHVSCGNLVCTLKSCGHYEYSSEKKGYVPFNISQFITVGNERFKASPYEPVVYENPNAQEE